MNLYEIETLICFEDLKLLSTKKITRKKIDFDKTDYPYRIFIKYFKNFDLNIHIDVKITGQLVYSKMSHRKVKFLNGLTFFFKSKEDASLFKLCCL